MKYLNGSPVSIFIEDDSIKYNVSARIDDNTRLYTHYVDIFEREMQYEVRIYDARKSPVLQIFHSTYFISEYTLLEVFNEVDRQLIKMVMQENEYIIFYGDQRGV